MYLKINDHDDMAKVIDFMESQKIPFVLRDNSHECVIADEAEFIMGEGFVENTKAYWLKDGIFTPSEVKKAGEKLKEVMAELIEDTECIVLENDSFLSVQENIRDWATNEVVERINNEE